MKRNIDISIGEFYHIYNRGTDKRIIFSDDYDYRRFILQMYLCNNEEQLNLADLLKYSKPADIFKINKGKTLVDICAWCLMPNHFHILIKENVPGGAIAFMQRLSTSHSKYYNRKYHRAGSLFQGPFKAKHLDYDQYLKYNFTYIHLNPISLIDKGWKEKIIGDKKKAKDFLEKYEYSSYQDYCGNDRPEGKILNKKAFPEYFETATDFKEMVEEWINFDTEDEDKATL
jgi:putative transposase